MHHCGIPRDTQSMITYNILTECFWKFQVSAALILIDIITKTEKLLVANLKQAFKFCF